MQRNYGYANVGETLHFSSTFIHIPLEIFDAVPRAFSPVGEARKNSDGDVVSPRFTSWQGWTEKDSWCRRAKWPGRPRRRREHTSWRAVSFVPFATLFTGDVAECYGDQDRYGDPHAYADPYDLLVYATVALSWNERWFYLAFLFLHLNIKWHFFLMSGRKRSDKFFFIYIMSYIVKSIKYICNIY